MNGVDCRLGCFGDVVVMRRLNFWQQLLRRFWRPYRHAYEQDLHATIQLLVEHPEIHIRFED